MTETDDAKAAERLKILNTYTRQELLALDTRDELYKIREELTKLREEARERWGVWDKLLLLWVSFFVFVQASLLYKLAVKLGAI